MQFIIGYSKINVIGACTILNDAHFMGALGIADADFDHIAQPPQLPPNVIRTDFHDPECAILQTKAFDKLLNEFCNPSKIEAWIAQHGCELRSHILEQAAAVSGLLWYSLKTNLSLSFDKLEFKEFIDESSLIADQQKYVRHVKNKSSRHDLSDGVLVAGLKQSVADSGNQKWQLTNGHFFVEILSVGFRKTLGNNSALVVSPERLEQSLRLAYELPDFVESNLFKSLVQWQDDNYPYCFLKDECFTA